MFGSKPIDYGCTLVDVEGDDDLPKTGGCGVFVPGRTVGKNFLSRSLNGWQGPFWRVFFCRAGRLRRSVGWSVGGSVTVGMSHGGRKPSNPSGKKRRLQGEVNEPARCRTKPFSLLVITTTVVAFCLFGMGERGGERERERKKEEKKKKKKKK